jgi:hypothetical protein
MDTNKLFNDAVALSRVQAKQLVAYDYDNQIWIEDAAQARKLLIKQAHETWQLLMSSKGDEYCRATGQNKNLALFSCEQQLAELEQ